MPRLKSNKPARYREAGRWSPDRRREDSSTSSPTLKLKHSIHALPSLSLLQSHSYSVLTLTFPPKRERINFHKCEPRVGWCSFLLALLGGWSTEDGGPPARAWPMNKQSVSGLNEVRCLREAAGSAISPGHFGSHYTSGVKKTSYYNGPISILFNWIHESLYEEAINNHPGIIQL